MTARLNIFINKIEGILNPKNIIKDPEEIRSYSLDRTKDFTPSGSLLLFPKTTEQVQKIILYANEYHIPLVPSGGRTGYSGGAVASQGEVIVSLKKMNQILDFDFALPAVTAEAGVITKTLQEEVENKGYYFPVDFASSGSSMIGGNIATNAGGIRVIRYGPLRNWVLGLEVVTGRGDVLSFQSNLIKNNTGYDLKQLFIGSEGTLGIITKATILVTQKPRDTFVYLLAFSKFSQVIQSLELCRKFLKEMLCFEVFDSSCLNLVCKKHNLSYPSESLKDKNVWYVLIEIEKPENTFTIPYEDLLNEFYLIGLEDAIFSDVESIKKNLFRYREDISEAVAMSGKFHKNDISIPIQNMDSFVHRIKDVQKNNFQDFELFLFGHLGDGNIHINLLAPIEFDGELFRKKINEFDKILYQMVFDLKGSISAEHGIGLLKKNFLNFTKSEKEIFYMKELKKMFDPNGILNPGKIFDL
ncbi:MAG: FAD-binding oxidoreductase [Leptonema sp. (in: bacteria)]